MVFKGTAANSTYYYGFRSPENADKFIEECKKNADSREEWKANQTSTVSVQAQAAQLIRKDLKKNYPGTKFSVTSESFSMGDAVRIAYTDGPSYKSVDELVGKYQYGHFDGMTDMYENSNSIEGLPQTKYVQVNRRISEAVKAELHKELDTENSMDYQNDDRVHRESIQRNF